MNEVGDFLSTLNRIQIKSFTNAEKLLKKRYATMLEKFLIPETGRNCLSRHWMQKQRATCHAARISIEVLRRKFPNRVISRFGKGEWTPRLRDHTPRFFSVGLLEKKVCAKILCIKASVHDGT